MLAVGRPGLELTLWIRDIAALSPLFDQVLLSPLDAPRLAVPPTGDMRSDMAGCCCPPALEQPLPLLRALAERVAGAWLSPVARRGRRETPGVLVVGDAAGGGDPYVKWPARLLLLLLPASSGAWLRALAGCTRSPAPLPLC